MDNGQELMGILSCNNFVYFFKYLPETFNKDF